ncbi:hypothetical protein L1987_43111 [Smallanthus sonchifolius]|uniref:Uncharacterized protein n=1 Tax=Smallanthus sonchifolius TaxID=185202 RepID=A0ACB9GKN8_9ASTR|nr:hypothetical protein L1987_43111 [Smallanthus sonchifolius]
MTSLSLLKEPSSLFSSTFLPSTPLHITLIKPTPKPYPKPPPIRSVLQYNRKPELAGIDAGFITAITPANEAVLVTTPDITALRDADRVTGLLECDGIRDIKMIVNRVSTDLIRGEDMMSVLDVQEMLGLALLGVILEDLEVIRSTNRGFPLVLNKPPTLAGLAFEQAAWRLVEQDSMKAVMVEEEPKKKGVFLLFWWLMIGLFEFGLVCYMIIEMLCVQ